MGFQSFGSKISSNFKQGQTTPSMFRTQKLGMPEKIDVKANNQLKGNMNTNNINNNQLDNTIHASINEFIEETKSIEDDLLKLKQLTIQNKYNNQMSVKRSNKNMSHINNSISKPVKGHFSVLTSNEKGKVCRTADNSLEREQNSKRYKHTNIVNRTPNSMQGSVAKSNLNSRNLLKTPVTTLPSKL